MRDIMSWALPLGRIFGITVRIHLLSIVIIPAIILRIVTEPNLPEGIWVMAWLLTAVLFISVLLHEFGHCFGARHVDGEANEILMWPLGGLAYVQVPDTPRAHFIATIAGPAVNFGLAMIFGTVLVINHYLPPFSLAADPAALHLYNWKDGQTHGTRFAGAYLRTHDNGRTEIVRPEKVFVLNGKPLIIERRDWGNELLDAKLEKNPTAPDWANIIALAFWVNWFLLCLNILLPGFPLDGGRLLQTFIWGRTGDYRQATLVAVNAGVVVAVILVGYGFWFNNITAFALAMFVYLMSAQQRMILEMGMDESQLGYDFSQGYTSLERDEKQLPKREPNFIQRWLQRRAEEKARREQAQLEADEARMDALLDKINRLGPDSLTDEERRFLTRQSNRYKKRQP